MGNNLVSKKTIEKSSNITNPYSYEDVMWKTDPTKAYAGLADLFANLQPKTDPTKENELRRVAKTNAWIDLGKTLAEGLAMTAGQNTGNGAMPSIAPRGVNPLVAYSSEALAKLKDQYANQQNVYTQQMLAQKLREIQLGIDQDKFNRGVKLEAIHDQQKQKDSETEWEYKNRVLDAQNAERIQKQKGDEKNRFGISNPFAKKGEEKMIYFNNTGEEMAFYGYLFKNDPKLAKKATQIMKEIDGNIVPFEQASPQSQFQIRSLISQQNLNKADINEASTLTGGKLLYEQSLIEAEKQAKDLRENINSNVGQVTSFPKFFQPQTWTTPQDGNNQSTPQYSEQSKKKEEYDPFGL
jgi:hypothetical protein